MSLAWNVWCLICNLGCNTESTLSCQRGMRCNQIKISRRAPGKPLMAFTKSFYFPDKTSRALSSERQKYVTRYWFLVLYACCCKSEVAKGLILAIYFPHKQCFGIGHLATEKIIGTNIYNWVCTQTEIDRERRSPTVGSKRSSDGHLRRRGHYCGTTGEPVVLRRPRGFTSGRSVGKPGLPIGPAKLSSCLIGRLSVTWYLAATLLLCLRPAL